MAAVHGRGRLWSAAAGAETRGAGGGGSCGEGVGAPQVTAVAEAGSRSGDPAGTETKAEAAANAATKAETKAEARPW